MHKHWKSIYAIKDPNLRVAIVTIDSESDEGKKLACAFPACFSAEAYEDPVPLDAILRVAQEELISNPNASTLNVENACERLSVPFVVYAITKSQFEQNDHYKGYVTRSWHRTNSSQVGSVVALDGNEYIVLDNRYNELVLASTTRVNH